MLCTFPKNSDLFLLYMKKGFRLSMVFSVALNDRLNVTN
jgi:hypothetical protein